MYALSEKELSILIHQKEVLAVGLEMARPDMAGYGEMLNSFKTLAEIIGSADVKPFAVDVYNQTVTGEVTKPLTASASDADHIPCVAEPYVEETPFEEVKPEPVVEPEPVKEEPTPVVEEVKPEPVVEPEPVKEEPKPVVEDRVYTKAEVRAALGKARLEKGIDINAIVRSIGFSQFGEVPASRYADLMGAIANA